MGQCPEIKKERESQKLSLGQFVKKLACSTFGHGGD